MSCLNLDSFTQPNFDAISLRKKLHQHPELSGNEINTAKTITTILLSWGLTPITQVGGHGILCIIDSGIKGENTLLRADFDALLINETAQHQHVSLNKGIMHACGHDGHTASLLSVVHYFSHYPPKRGKVIFAFQPAEEVGTGAKAMLDSDVMQALRINNVFAYHNLPGIAAHHIVVKNNTFCCASVGANITLIGKTSHAAQPENGISPVKASLDIVTFLTQLPDRYPDIFSLVTVTHMNVGEATFGVSPGQATIMATLRSECNDTFRLMQQHLEQYLSKTKITYQIDINLDWHEPFDAGVNSSQAVDIIRKSAEKEQLKVHEINSPMRWSEDFCHFLSRYNGALFCIGSGINHAELHNPDYDFPDDIINTAQRLFIRIIKTLHNH